jgi:PAS domain S-box-containing protein
MDMNHGYAIQAPPTLKFDRLRRQAEELLLGQSGPEVFASADILDLIHELQVHQMELEIRNEELRRSQSEYADLHRQFVDLYENAPFGYLGLDDHGMITRINLAGVTLLGRVRAKILQGGFSRFVARDCEGCYLSALRLAAETGTQQRVELQLTPVGRSPQQSGLWVWAEIMPLHASSDGVTGYRMTLADITGKKAVECVLMQSEQKYRQLFNEMVGGAAVLEIERDAMGRIADFRVLEVNDASERLAGVTRDQVVGRTLRQIWPGTESFWFEYSDRLLRRGQPIQIEGFHAGIGKHLLVRGFPLDARSIAITFIDISAHKQLESELQVAGQKLQVQVKGKTAKLLQANRELKKQVEIRKQTQRSLLEKSHELEIRAHELEETHTALKVLLKEHERERGRLEEKVASNLNQLVRPQLEKLTADNLSPRQRAMIETIGQQLDHIHSPLSRRFIIEAHRLTLAEMQVANQIRAGKTTREIATLMGLAVSTIDYHRLNIRHKLKLTHQCVNLQSYLRSLT